MRKLICGLVGCLGLINLSVASESPVGLRVASSATTDDLAATWTASFAKRHPSDPAPEIVRGRYPTDALEAVIAGRADVALVAREPYESELASARQAGKGELRFIPIATGSRATRGGTHAIAFFVHAANPLKALSVSQLREILADKGRIRTWGDLGVTGPLASRAIVVHGQPVRRASGNPPGIVNFLSVRLLNGRTWRTDLVAHDDQQNGPTALEAIVEAVKADPSAIGWSGFDYRLDGTKTLALGSSPDGPFYAGTSKEVAEHAYPLARDVYVCLTVAASAAAEEFVRLVLQPAEQAAIAASSSGFSPLTEEVRARTLHRLAAAHPTADVRVRIVGYNDMQEMMASWTRAFAFDHPQFRFELELPATRAAVDAVASGRAAFGPLGAELSDDQLVRFRELAGADPLQIRVAHASLDRRALSGPLAILVHPSNPRREISVPELAAIFAARNGAAELEPVGLAADRALGIFFRQRVLRGAPFGSTFQSRVQSAQVVEAVASNPRAIGFAAAVRADDRVRILAVSPSRERPAVELTAQNLMAGTYPLDRHLWLLLPSKPEPWIKEFLRLVLSDQGQRIVAEGSLGYLPLSVEDRQAELKKIR